MLDVLAVALLSTGPAAANDLAQRLADRATQPDVVLMPPVGEPSPKPGSFMRAYRAPEGQEPDPDRVGTYEVAPSSCSEALVFKSVPASENRTELWRMVGGAGLRLGLPKLGIQMGGSSTALAGIRYQLSEKLIVDGGLEELEMCCLRSPEKCTDRYISEAWKGGGELYRMMSSESAMKTSLKTLDKLGKIDFGATKGWSSASTWGDDMYFAYRVQSFQPPSCESFMNNLPEVKQKVLFTGVSKRKPSEQEARRDARTDARQQVVRYLGEEFHIEGDEVISSAEALLSGVKDSLTCLDPTLSTPEGPHYLARVRMYVDKDKVEAAAATMRSGSE